LGDELFIEEAAADGIECNLEGVPCDESNLVMKAAILFREATGLDRHFKFKLIKQVPHGAGLGGGSSNGAIALKAVNEICGSPLELEDMTALSAHMGSDCPLFLTGRPVIMSGRGEHVDFVEESAEDVIRSLKLLIFKPAFSINTGWAYKRMRESGKYYVTEKSARDMLKKWLDSPSIETLPLFNNMQPPAFSKFPALEAVLEFVRAKYAVPAIMSGSGSACFAIVNNLEADGLESLKLDLRERLGDTCFISEA
jgi:4-diphosphocytidyl-2-C-methyl-D-erythritol kinase